jgi:hypothetical protein
METAALVGAVASVGAPEFGVEAAVLFGAMAVFFDVSDPDPPHDNVNSVNKQNATTETRLLRFLTIYSPEGVFYNIER